MNALVKLNALRRLKLKLHGEAPQFKGRREWNTRVFDGDTLVGCVEWGDLAGAMDEYKAIKSMFPDGGNDNLSLEQRTINRLGPALEASEHDKSIYMGQFCRAHYLMRQLMVHPLLHDDLRAMVEEADRDIGKIRKAEEQRREKREAKEGVKS